MMPMAGPFNAATRIGRCSENAAGNSKLVMANRCDATRRTSAQFRSERSCTYLDKVDAGTFGERQVAAFGGRHVGSGREEFACEAQLRISVIQGSFVSFRAPLPVRIVATICRRPRVMSAG